MPLPRQLLMAKLDHGLWLGNVAAVVLVVLVLATSCIAFQSIMAFDAEQFRKSQWASQ